MTNSVVDTRPWRTRLEAWLAAGTRPSLPFLDPNRAAIERSLTHPESGLRVVVNIPADALLAFLRDGAYKNAYDLPIVAGHSRGPSAARQRVDRLLGFRAPQNYFYGAAAMGGTGVRFYGEYCLVLKPDRVPPGERVFDRNSYDLLYPPLSNETNPTAVVDTLRGTWKDTVDMLVLKVLPELEATNRLITLGTVSDAILHDEDFLEVHRKGTFTPDDLEEIRETPEDQAIHGHITEYLEEGGLPTLEEMVWVARRMAVARELRRRGIRTRVVSSSGRGSRWD